MFNHGSTDEIDDGAILAVAVAVVVVVVVVTAVVVVVVPAVVVVVVPALLVGEALDELAGGLSCVSFSFPVITPLVSKSCSLQ